MFPEDKVLHFIFGVGVLALAVVVLAGLSISAALGIALLGLGVGFGYELAQMLRGDGKPSVSDALTTAAPCLVVGLILLVF